MSRRSSDRERAWRDVMSRQRASGQSVRSFCRCEGLAESAFYFWRRTLQRRKVPKAQPKFVPVRVIPEEGSVVGCLEPNSGEPSASGPKDVFSPIEVVLPGGVLVRVPPGCEVQSLRTVLDALERPAC